MRTLASTKSRARQAAAAEQLNKMVDLVVQIKVLQRDLNVANGGGQPESAAEGGAVQADAYPVRQLSRSPSSPIESCADGRARGLCPLGCGPQRPFARYVLSYVCCV